MYSNHITHIMVQDHNNHNIHITSMYSNHIMAQEALMVREAFPLGEGVMEVAVSAVQEDLEMAAKEGTTEGMADVSPEARVELPTAAVPPRDRVEEWAGIPPKAPTAWTPTSSCLRKRSLRSQSLNTMARSMA